MSRSSDYSSFGASPSVSKERWVKHALAKLSKGYMLIVSTERSIANFYKGYGEYESCSYHAARRLIKNGFVEADGEHSMGTIYRLQSDHEVEVHGTPEVKEENQLTAEESDTDILIEEDDSIADELDDPVELDDTVDDDLALDA